MKIGIIVHSHTGNTLSVAQLLCERLLHAGHLAQLEQIIPENDGEADVTKVRLKSIPDAGNYDALVFACPVRGASITPVLSAYLMQIGPLQKKKVACFVTQYFPYPWMGGNRAIGQIKAMCQSKGADICGVGIVNWKNKQRQQMIKTVVDELCRLF